jgi:hypothetical protein
LILNSWGGNSLSKYETKSRSNRKKEDEFYLMYQNAYPGKKAIIEFSRKGGENI